MPIIHKSLELLRNKLAKYEPYEIERRVGSNYTVVFLVDELKYDKNIPILSRDSILEWLKRQKSSDPTAGSSSSYVTCSSPPSSPPPSSSSSVADTCSSSPSQTNSVDATAVCQSKVDSLIISEPIDDEYRDMDDDDTEEEETQLSKNLKKIRTAPVVKPKTTNAENNTDYKSLSSTSLNQPFRPPQQKPQSPPPPTSPLPAPPPQRVPTPPPPKPVEPDWSYITRRLQENNFHDVYKELQQFKDKIKASDAARSLPKEAVLKCICEDETAYLMNLLQLVFELEYYEDVEFWSELVGRLKRKLSGHAQVKCFKVKTNPEWVFANYQQAIHSVSEYSKFRNLTLRLPFQTMVFLIDPFNHHNLNGPKPAVANGGNTVKTEVKVEKQENTDPAAERYITLCKNADGRPIFRITKPLDNGSRKNGTLRMRL